MDEEERFRHNQSHPLRNIVDRFYVSGPMSNQPFHGLADLLRAGRELEDLDFMATVPGFSLNAANAVQALLHEMEAIADDEYKPLSWERCLSTDIQQGVIGSSGLSMLPGWEKSKGATFEALIGAELNKPLYEHQSIVDWDPKRIYYPEVLEAFLDLRPQPLPF